MQHTNDDIDDLYRNAADNYPLKINGADWDSIAGRLGGSNDAAAPVLPFVSQKPNKNYRYLLLLLLLPLGFFAAKYAGVIGSGHTTTAQQPAGNASNANAIAAQPAAPATGNANSAVQPATQAAIPPAGTSSQQPGGNVGKNTAGYAPAAAKNRVQTMVVKTPGVASSTSQPGTDENITVTPAAVPPLSQLGAINKQNEIAEKLNNLHLTSPSVPVVTAEQPNNVQAAPNSGTAAATQPTVKDELVKHPAETTTVTAVAGKAGDKGNGNGDVNEPVRKPTQKHLYVGAFVAPDYTTVKYQPGNKVGFDFGGLVGFSLSRSLSLEVGVSLDKKYYTSDGKYYNTANQKWIENAGKLLTLSGYSSLTEFPINVKYGFKPGRDGNFFISGGLVSYIVHEENYDYEFDKGGYIYHKDKSTKKSTTNTFANFNISAGYESSLGHGINFRVEPYYRIPVKGIGLGGLPITSVGLNIGIIKKIK